MGMFSWLCQQSWPPTVSKAGSAFDDRKQYYPRAGLRKGSKDFLLLGELITMPGV